MTERKKQSDHEDAPDPNELLAKNLAAILGNRTPEAYCRDRKPIYISGTKKGKRVGARTFRAVIAGEFSPRLDFIAAIAWAESLEPYQLMFYDFDPSNAPVMISRAQETFLKSLQRAAKEMPNPRGPS